MPLEDDLEDDDPPPRLIGRCSIVPSSSSGICGRKIYDNDDEYVELDRGLGLVCGECVARLLRSKPVSEEPEKPGNPKKGNTRTGARLSQGPQGRTKESK